MALDLSFKDLVDAATRNPSMDGRPLLIPLSQIDEDHDQPRRAFNEEELTQLADSIRLVGILQPIVVRPGQVSGRYFIIMGARRYRAARLVGLDSVPAIVQEGYAPDRYAQIIENIQRDDLATAECQLASKIDPRSAFKIDPPFDVGRNASARPGGAGGVAQPGRVRFGSRCDRERQARFLKRQLSLPVSTMSQW